MTQERAVSVVSGRTLSTSLRDFTTRCERLILEEQAKAMPDTALIGTLCDAVRLAREYTDAVGRHHGVLIP